MSRAEIALFLSGLFFGGAMDYAILALLRSEHTPYGARVSIKGNWAFAGFDLFIAVAGCVLYSQLVLRTNRRDPYLTSKSPNASRMAARRKQ